MINLFKLIKTMSNNDTLTLYIEEDNQSVVSRLKIRKKIQL